MIVLCDSRETRRRPRLFGRRLARLRAREPS